MKKIFILVLGITIILVGIFVIKSKSDKQTQTVKIPRGQLASEKIVSILLDKPQYSIGESITFDIRNDTEESIYFYPNTCASDLVQLYLVEDDVQTKVKGDATVCTLAPSVTTLTPNQTIKGEVNKAIYPYLAPGEFKLQFEYSTESPSRFSLGSRKSVYSSLFTLIK